MTGLMKRLTEHHAPNVTFYKSFNHIYMKSLSPLHTEVLTSASPGCSHRAGLVSSAGSHVTIYKPKTSI